MTTRTSNTFIHSRRGQTLVEALVALSILTMGFLGITALLTRSFQLNRTTTDDTQATYLAAEGIEIVKNLIDHDVYAGLPGNDYFGQCFYDGSGYYYPIDYETVASTVPSPDCSGILSYSTTASAANTPLYFNSSTKLYSRNAFGAAATGFVRNIKITEISNPGAIAEIDVQSTVTWTDAGLGNSITLEDHFYNWHP